MRVKDIAKVAVVATLGFSVMGCSGTSAAATPTPAAAPPAVRVVLAERGRVVSSLTYPGNVQTRAQVPIVPEVAGRIKKLSVDVGGEVKAGDLIAEIDASAYKIQQAQTEAALAAAQAKLASLESGARPEQVALAAANLKSAQERLAGMMEGGRAETIAQAEANLQAAQARLDQVKKGPTPEQLAVLEGQLKVAKNQEYLAQQNVEELSARTNGGKSHSVQTPLFSQGIGDAQTGIAYEQVKTIEAQIAQLKASPTAEQVAQLQAAVNAVQEQLVIAKSPYSAHDLAQSESAVAVAEQQLALTRQPFTINDLNATRAAVDQAKAAVDLAKLQVQKATITAPLDGRVSQRLLAEGAMAGPTTPLLVLVARDVEVIVNVEEAKLGRVKAGQVATLSVAAYPGETFPAEVTAIAPSVDPRSRTVAVRIRPQPNAKLIDGMFAQVSIVAGEQVQALRVPAGAVVEREGAKTVWVVQDGVARARAVRTGLSDGALVEVVEGLAEGDQVVAQGGDVLADGQAVRPQR
ncbi:MAG: efflux RND transporter periplasmic adaptor subunit [Chloroflexota bacterium]